MKLLAYFNELSNNHINFVPNCLHHRITATHPERGLLPFLVSII
nr:hypothetical protein [Mucilaginibacter sp. E4BP6]